MVMRQSQAHVHSSVAMVYTSDKCHLLQNKQTNKSHRNCYALNYQMSGNITKMVNSIEKGHM